MVNLNQNKTLSSTITTKSKLKKKQRDGNAFFGLSLSRKSALGNAETITHQTAFDLNELCDRSYTYIESTDEDGFLVGGGEKSDSYKLPAKDTAHIELMRIGTFRPDWGGISEEEIIKVLYSGKLLIPEIQVIPTAISLENQSSNIENVVTSNTSDICLRFDMIPSIPDFSNTEAELPLNWSLRFIQNQLLEYFPGRQCPTFFHVTIAKRVQFYSKSHETLYLGKCYNIIKEWRNQGPKSLNNGGWEADGSYIGGFVNDQRQPNEEQHYSGIWLFENRHLITHFFLPNFLPPYDTPSKREIIYNYLRKEWDGKEFRFVGHRFLDEMKRWKLRNKEKSVQQQRETAIKEDRYGCPPLCGAVDNCVPS